jgi:DNA-binding transcriptional MerR regulator
MLYSLDSVDRMTAKREVFKSPDVCVMAQLQPYVLRSWEAEFPGLGRPAPSGIGRVYRRADVDLVLRIKELVFVEGLTLAGARRRLEEEQPSEPLNDGDSGDHDSLGDVARRRLREVRAGLQAILQLLSREQATAMELQLVAPPAREASGRRNQSSAPTGMKTSGTKRRRAS